MANSKFCSSCGLEVMAKMQKCPNCSSTAFALAPRKFKLPNKAEEIPPQRNSSQDELRESKVYQPKSFTESIKYTFSKFGSLSGRASRSEFWYFSLFWVIASLFATMADVVIGFLLVQTESIRSFVWFGLISSISLFIPSMSVFIRRAHDIGYSATWFLPIFIAVQAGSLFVIVIGNMRVVWPIVIAWLSLTLLSYLFLIRRGTPGPNRFGDVPPSFTW